MSHRGVTLTEILALVLDPSGRDVFAGNYQVLERIDIDLLGEIAMEGQVRMWDRCGYAHPEKGVNEEVLEKIGIT